MFQPSPQLQLCLGLSCCLLSFGGMWSMVTGANVKGGIAGAHFSVNEKLQAVENIHGELERATQELKLEPAVSRRKIKAIELELEQTNKSIDQASQQISEDLESLIDSEPE